jgi:hypothetical protein
MPMRLHRDAITRSASGVADESGAFAAATAAGAELVRRLGHAATAEDGEEEWQKEESFHAPH